MKKYTALLIVTGIYLNFATPSVSSSAQATASSPDTGVNFNFFRPYPNSTDHEETIKQHLEELRNSASVNDFYKASFRLNNSLLRRITNGFDQIRSDLFSAKIKKQKTPDGATIRPSTMDEIPNYLDTTNGNVTCTGTHFDPYDGEHYDIFYYAGKVQNKLVLPAQWIPGDTQIPDEALALSLLLKAYQDLTNAQNTDSIQGLDPTIVDTFIRLRSSMLPMMGYESRLPALTTEQAKVGAQQAVDTLNGALKAFENANKIAGSPEPKILTKTYNPESGPSYTIQYLGIELGSTARGNVGGIATPDQGRASIALIGGISTRSTALYYRTIETQDGKKIIVGGYYTGGSDTLLFGSDLTLSSKFKDEFYCFRHKDFSNMNWYQALVEYRELHRSMYPSIQAIYEAEREKQRKEEEEWLKY